MILTASSIVSTAFSAAFALTTAHAQPRPPVAVPACVQGAPELCNGYDDNCNGVIDEGCYAPGPQPMPPAPQPMPPAPQPYPGPTAKEVAFFNRHLFRDEGIELTYPLNLGRHPGGVIESLIVSANLLGSGYGGDTATVLIFANGMQIGRADLFAGQPIDHNVATQPISIASLSSLQLRVIQNSPYSNGTVFLDRVTALIREGGGGFPGGPGYLSRPLNQRFRGDTVLPLRQILNLDQSFVGQRVQTVELTASSVMGDGLATVEVNGYPVGSVTLPTMQGHFSIPVGRVLGHEIQTLRLHLQGNIFVDDVGVRLGNGWGEFNRR